MKIERDCNIEMLKKKYFPKVKQKLQRKKKYSKKNKIILQELNLCIYKYDDIINIFRKYLDANYQRFRHFIDYQMKYYIVKPLLIKNKYKFKLFKYLSEKDNYNIYRNKLNEKECDKKIKIKLMHLDYLQQQIQVCQNILIVMNSNHIITSDEFINLFNVLQKSRKSL